MHDGGAQDGRPPRTRRVRSATESLLSIVLVLEAFLVFFATLVVYSLGILEPAPAFLGGAALLVLLLIAGSLQRSQWGQGLGGILQAVIIASGVLVPWMYVIGAGFAALWVYCFVTGRRLDRGNAGRSVPGSTG